MSHLQEQNVGQRQRAQAAAGEDGEPGEPVEHDENETQRERGGHAAQPHSPAHPLVSLNILPGHRGRASQVTDGLTSAEKPGNISKICDWSRPEDGVGPLCWQMISTLKQKVHED